tara:strand:- start:486 stop:653 length:168 start_codon:yes stop_codon:yes gene_type:complete
LIQDSDDCEVHKVDHSAFVKVKSEFPPKQGKENEDDENEENAIELPEFSKTVKAK